MGSTVVNEYVIELEDGQFAVIAEGEEAERLFRSRLTKSDSVPARVSLRDAGDTEGHAASGSVVAITLDIDDDTEGHALSLRFPTADAARDFEKRLLTTGLLISAVAATAVGIGVGQSAQGHATAVAAPAPIVNTVAGRDTDKLQTVAVPVRDTDKLQSVAVPVRDTDKLDSSAASSITTAVPARDTDKLQTVAVPARDTDKLESSTVAVPTRDTDKLDSSGQTVSRTPVIRE
jgi:hypothetical protein